MPIPFQERQWRPSKNEKAKIFCIIKYYVARTGKRSECSRGQLAVQYAAQKTAAALLAQATARHAQ
jgi:hypothetical protein